MLKSIVLLVILITYFCADARSDEAGVKVRISKSGLLFGVNRGVDLLIKELVSLKIPDFFQETNQTSFNITNIKLTKFDKPSAKVDLATGPGVRVTLKNAAVRISFNRNCATGPPPSASAAALNNGTGFFETESNSIDAAVVLGRDPDGKATVNATSCSCLISASDIRASASSGDDPRNTTGRLRNFMNNLFENKIKNRIEYSTCDNIVKVINAHGNSRLATFDTEVKIDSEILFDYRMTSNPVLTSEYMETSHAGVFFTSTGIRFNRTTPSLPIVMDGNKMANLALTERLFNSAAYVLQRLGRINQIFPINDEDLASLLNQPKDTKFLVKIETIEAPFIKITAPSFVINAITNLQLQILNGSVVHSAQLSLFLSCDIFFENDRIKGKVNSIVPQTGNSSKISGTPASTRLTSLLAKMVNLSLRVLNEGGAVGFPIPSLKQLGFADPVLYRSDGYAVLGVDLKSQ